MTTPTTIKTIREGLGLTAAELAQALGVTERSVFAWEAGDTKPRAKVMAKLDALQDEAAAEVAEHVATFTAEGSTVPAVMTIEAERPGWQRAIAFRVMQVVPELVVIEADGASA